MKRILCILILMSVFTLAAAADGTAFTVKYTDSSKSTMDIEIDTDTVNGVGGIDMMISYDTNKWELVENSARCALKQSEISAGDGSVRFIWDTVDKTEIVKKLMTVSFKKRDNDAEITDILLNVNEYYDNTVELNDIPYDVKYEQADKIESVKTVNKSAIIAIIVIAVLALSAAAAYYYLKLQKKESKH